MATKTATATKNIDTAPAGELASIETIDEIDTSFLQPLEVQAAGYPALQASKYKNLAEDSVINLGLSASAADALGGDGLALLVPRVISVKFDKQEEHFYVPDPSIKWIPLAFPKKYIEDNSGQRRVYRQAGGEWNDKCKTVCRLLLAAVDGDNNLLIDEGSPMVFSLTFRGKRTQRITGKEGSLLSLNAALCKRYGVAVNAYMGHLTSVQIEAKVSEYVSSSDASLTSLAPDFVMSKATILPKAIQSTISAFIKEDQRLASAIADPFGVVSGQPAEAVLEDHVFDPEMPF